MTSRLDELLAVLSNSPTWAAMRSTCSAWACSSAFAIARFPLLHDLEMVGPVVEAGGGPQFLRAKARYPSRGILLRRN